MNKFDAVIISDGKGYLSAAKRAGVVRTFGDANDAVLWLKSADVEQGNVACVRSTDPDGQAIVLAIKKNGEDVKVCRYFGVTVNTDTKGGGGSLRTVKAFLMFEDACNFATSYKMQGDETSAQLWVCEKHIVDLSQAELYDKVFSPDASIPLLYTHIKAVCDVGAGKIRMVEDK